MTHFEHLQPWNMNRNMTFLWVIAQCRVISLLQKKLTQKTVI